MRNSAIRLSGHRTALIAGTLGAALTLAVTIPADAAELMVVPPRVVVAPAAGEMIAPMPPPNLRVEVVPAAPDDSVYWRPGHWVWNNGDWAWDAGHYVARPRRTAMWEPGRWTLHPGGGYVWSEGHWD